MPSITLGKPPRPNRAKSARVMNGRAINLMRQENKAYEEMFNEL